MSFLIAGRLKIFSCLVITAFLTACTPSSQPFEESPKAEPVVESTAFHTSDSTALSLRSWVPKKKPKAIIVALHGMNDYSHAFEGMGNFFKAHDIALYAYDQRGFGQSPGVGIWGGLNNFTSDLKQYVIATKKENPHTPIYILGESMGGAITIVALADPTFPKVDGIILSAPAVWGEETIPFYYRGTLWIAAHTVPYMQLSGRDLKIIASNNYPMLRALSQDPLVIKETRVDAMYGMVHLMDSAYDKVSDLNTHILLLYGGHDQVIPKKPVEQALARFSVPIDYAYYPEGYHLLLRDLQAKMVMKDILSWINHPEKSLPSGHGIRHEPPQ